MSAMLLNPSGLGVENALFAGIKLGTRSIYKMFETSPSQIGK